MDELRLLNRVGFTNLWVQYERLTNFFFFLFHRDLAASRWRRLGRRSSLASTTNRWLPGSATWWWRGSAITWLNKACSRLARWYGSNNNKHIACCRVCLALVTTPCLLLLWKFSILISSLWLVHNFSIIWLYCDLCVMNTLYECRLYSL